MIEVGGERRLTKILLLHISKTSYYYEYIVRNKTTFTLPIILHRIKNTKII